MTTSGRTTPSLRRRVADVITLVRRRYTNDGPISAITYLRWLFANLYVRTRNRFCRTMRVECPCCGWRGHDFLTLDCGTFTVPHVECPSCQGHERHRMMHLYLDRRYPEFFTAKGRVLHFAPERHVRDLILRNPALTCLSTDYGLWLLHRFPGPSFQSDMQFLSAKDSVMDFIFCLHVLEHVPDDRKGIRELHRVLKPGGSAFVMVPFMMGWNKTVEFGFPDPAVFEHVRGYSPNDFRDRLEPFAYDEVHPTDFLSVDELNRYQIHANQVIYRCTKPG